MKVSRTGTFNINYDTGKFIKEGTLKVHILPNGSWEGAHEFFVRVTK